MKTIILLLIVLKSFGQGYQDSLLIFNYYKNQIDSLIVISSRLDFQSWFKIEDKKDSGIACAFLRLKKANGESYLPLRTKEVEGFGLAYFYPHPDSIYGLAFSVLFKITKFKLGKPYWDKYYYSDKGRVMRKEEVNPITLKKIN